jgi:hypothetical protein
MILPHPDWTKDAGRTANLDFLAIAGTPKNAAPRMVVDILPGNGERTLLIARECRYQAKKSTGCNSTAAAQLGMMMVDLKQFLDLLSRRQLRSATHCVELLGRNVEDPVVHRSPGRIRPRMLDGRPLRERPHGRPRDRVHFGEGGFGFERVDNFAEMADSRAKWLVIVRVSEASRWFSSRSVLFSPRRLWQKSHNSVKRFAFAVCVFKHSLSKAFCFSCLLLKT